MSIQDIYNSILFILENKGLPSYYLDFIVGVDEYLVGKKALNEVSIFIQDDKLFCMLKDEEIDYHEILSLVQFSPLYIRDDKVYWNITTGRYKIDNFNISDCIILKKNLFHPENNYDYLMFKVIKNPTLSVNYFLKNPDVLMTCSTSFPYNKIEECISNEQFVKLKSNIRIFFKIKQDLMEIKNEISSFIKAEMEKNIKLKKGIVLDFNYVTEVKKEQARVFDKIPLNPIKILFANFYPNSILVDYLSLYFRRKNIQVILFAKNNMKDFIDEYNLGNYDVSLLLTSPLMKNQISWLEYFIYTLNRDLQDTYVNIVNQRCENKNYEEVENFLIKNSNVVPVGFINHLFLKREISQYWIDSNDVVQFINSGNT